MNVAEMKFMAPIVFVAVGCIFFGVGWVSLRQPERLPRRGVWLLLRKPPWNKYFGYFFTGFSILYLTILALMLVFGGKLVY